MLCYVSFSFEPTSTQKSAFQCLNSYPEIAVYIRAGWLRLFTEHSTLLNGEGKKNASCFLNKEGVVLVAPGLSPLAKAILP